MGKHLDVIRPDWISGTEVLVARVRLSDAGVEVENVHGDWSETLLRPVSPPGAMNGDRVYAEKDPEQFFGLLPQAIHGSYLYASEPHKDRACPFRGHNDARQMTLIAGSTSRSAPEK